ncbi:MAG: hypothetical protein EZS28_003240 [Streblomastix strix]|uniref:Uncharacterized protein n=1 Tax=Streblomastix strix TaxID=222440 RepID=A0A5J4X1L5_9EUKA|nr:MAG: hypothetical protein EZS28_003240 [Streblomastix strix]
MLLDTGDEQDQAELVSKGYVRANVIAISTAGGQGEEQDEEIDNGLSYLSRFLKELYQGRLNPKIPDQPPFPPLPSFARSSKEQIEEEGGYEEVEAQLINKGQRYNIKDSADFVKRRILYYYVDKSNPKPRWYNGRF